VPAYHCLGIQFKLRPAHLRFIHANATRRLVFTPAKTK